MRILRTLAQDTREGFRLLVAWAIGFLSFAVLLEVSQHAILYFQPWKAEGMAESEAELFLLFSLLALGFAAILAALAFEGVQRRNPSRLPRRLSD